MIPRFHRAVAASRGVAVRRRARYAAGGAVMAASVASGAAA